MGRRGGLLAEINRQAKRAAREAEKQRRARERAHQKAIRDAERARKAHQRATEQLERANERERKRLEKEARQSHVASMVAEAERLNAELSAEYERIDSLLAATLDVDDHVDLDGLYITAEHPPFDRVDLESPTPKPPPVEDPPEPVYVEPEPPRGLFAFLGKSKFQLQKAEAERDHSVRLNAWRDELAANAVRREQLIRAREERERERLNQLRKERDRYSSECKAREAAAVEHNKLVDQFKGDLSYGVPAAVSDYVELVVSNSEYPESFPVDYEFEFVPDGAELRLRVCVPEPGALPNVKAYRYVKSKDEITSSNLSKKASKDRYVGAVHQVALRALHEMFEADRKGIIKSISLQVGANGTDPATGGDVYVCLVAVAAERESFLKLKLERVTPLATLEHLGAAVSKKPFELVPVDPGGVRMA